MIKIKDGRTELYQWDTGSVLTVGEGIDEVHFARSPMGRSITVPVVSGEAKVEDVLLQTAGKLFVWGFVGSAEDGYTKLEREFTVRARNKPADYVFTPPEQITLSEILEELKRVQDVVTPEAVGALVEEYLRENPVDGAVQIDATLTKEGFAADAKAVGDALSEKLGADKLGDAVDNALRQAKESGEFNGAPGKPGDDYVLTDADKSEIAELVGIPDSGSYRLLKTITVEEGVQRISESWGTGYDGKGYDGAVVIFDNISGIENANGMIIYASIGSPQTLTGVGATLKNTQVMRLVARKLNGLWDIFGSYGARQGASTMIGQTATESLYSTEKHNATPDGYRFSWDQLSRALFYTFSESLPVGMTIKIFVLGGDENA